MKTIMLTENAYAKILHKKQKLELKENRIWSMGKVIEKLINENEQNSSEENAPNKTSAV